MSDEPHQVEIPADALFWELVGLANRDWDAFEARLEELPIPLLAGFAAMFWELASVFWQWVMNRTGCSDDDAEEIGGRLVARGREFVIAALQAPARTITDELLESDEGTGLEIMHEAETRYFKRTGRDFTAACEGPFYRVKDSVYGPLVAKALRS